MTQARALNGSFDQTKIAFAQYLYRWRQGVYPDHIDTKAVQAFLARPFNEAVKWAPARMVDSVLDMLEAYRKNANGPHGSSALFPVMLLAMDDNYIGTGDDWGGIDTPRDVIQLIEGGSWYGYQQAAMDRRAQVVIVASEGGSAQSLAAQLRMFVRQPENRYMQAVYQFGEYALPVPITLETNRIDFMDVKTEQNNLKVLCADFTLKCTIPYVDAPATGEPNDGSAHNPPGYPLTQLVNYTSKRAGVAATITEAGIDWGGIA